MSAHADNFSVSEHLNASYAYVVYLIRFLAVQVDLDAVEQAFSIDKAYIRCCKEIDMDEAFLGVGSITTGVILLLVYIIKGEVTFR